MGFCFFGLILLAIVAVVLFRVNHQRSENLETLRSLLDDVTESGSEFWGHRLSGRYRNRLVVCTGHSKATDLYLFSSLAHPQNQKNTPHLIGFLPYLIWPNISTNSTFHKGRLRYAGFGAVGSSFYYRAISKAEFKEILDELSNDAERLEREGEETFRSNYILTPKLKRFAAFSLLVAFLAFILR